MSRKDAIDTLFLKGTSPGMDIPARSAGHVRTGAISAMGESLQAMADNARQVKELQQQLADGETVISIDPSRVEHSWIADRIPFDIDPVFDQLMASIAENGQQVPVLVRPSPAAPGSFQIAYGRRRLKAALLLGVPVRAIVRQLTDRELIVAQGRENLDRRDLSFIERAFFARNLEDHGYDRATIIAALGSDKADVSRYISVARKIPEELVERIGPAPKAGRARWLSLVEQLDDRSALPVALQLLDSDALAQADSDRRFEAVLHTLQGGNAGMPVLREDPWTTPLGEQGARIETRGGKTSIIFENNIVPRFAQFVSTRLDELYRDFQKTDEGEQQQ